MSLQHIVTVKGLIDACETGICLPHEHLFADLRFACPAANTDRVRLSNLYKLRDSYTSLSNNLLLSSFYTAEKELRSFAEYSGMTLVDVTSIGLGRRPSDLKKLSELTGVNIVMGTGYYLRQSLGKAIINASESSLIDTLIKECLWGVGGSGIRPGIIGEIGIGPGIGEWERKSISVATKVQQETGLAVTYHIQAVPVVRGFVSPNGVSVVRQIEKSGGDLSRTIIDHCDAKIDISYIADLLATGVYVEFDHFGKSFYFPDTNFAMSTDMERVLAIRDLISRGFAGQLLISQDICLKTDLLSYGGQGYSHILRNIVPMLRNNGVSDESIEQILKVNVRNVLSMEYGE